MPLPAETPAALAPILYADPVYRAAEALDLLVYIAEPAHWERCRIPGPMGGRARQLARDSCAPHLDCDPVQALTDLLAPAVVHNPAWVWALLDEFRTSGAYTQRLATVVAAAATGPFAGLSPDLLRALHMPGPPADAE